MKLTKREYQLLNLLLTQNGYQSAAFFSSQLSVSTKTIYSDLNNIQGYLKKNSLKINRVPRKGIYLIGSTAHKEQLKSVLSREALAVLENESFSPAYRQLIILSDVLLYEKKGTYDDYAARFLISKQSIKKDMDEVFDYLKVNELKSLVEHKSNILEKETKIQEVYKKYLIDYSKKYHPHAENNQRDNLIYFSAIINPKIVYQVNLFMETLMTHTGKVLNDYFVYSLRLSLSILLTRLSLNHHIEEQNEFVFKDLQKMQLYMIALTFSEQVNQELNCLFFKQDIQYLCSLLLAHGVVPNTVDLPINPKIHTTTIALIDEMAHLLNVAVDKDQQLYYSLISHIVPMIHRLKNDIYVRNPLKGNIKRQYTTMFTLTQFASVVFEKQFGLFLNDDEVSFLTIHFQVAFEKIQSTKHVLIVCSNGLATSELIFNRIKQNLPASVIVDIATEKQVIENPVEGIDLIISAIPLKRGLIPILHVSALPTADEVAMIATYLSNISEHENTLMYSKKKNPVSVGSFIQDELIFLNMDFETKEEILNYLVDQYDKLGFVEIGFRESIFQRESLGNTSIVSGVAIPHSSLDAVKETKISFMTMKHPVQWGVNEVCLVVTIAIAEKDLSIAKDLVSALYDIIDSAENVQELIKSQNTEELMAYVRKGGDENVF